MFARAALVLAGSGLAVLACVDGLPLENRICPCDEPTWTCCNQICVPRQRAAACFGGNVRAEPPATTDAPSSAPMPDAVGSLDAAAPADAPVGPGDASSQDDAAAVEPALDAPPDRPDLTPQGPCQGSARSCSADQTATFSCEGGRWRFDRTCLDGTLCSAGDCVCRPESCQESVLVRLAAYIPRIAVGGEFLYYQKDNADTNVTGLHRLNLRTNEMSAIVADGPDHSFGTMVADASGVLTWCRMGSSQVGPAIMRGTQLFDAVPCGRVAVSDSHVYFTRTDRPGIFRRALDRPGRETVWQGDLLGFRVAGPYVYFSKLDDASGTVESISVSRLSLAGMQPGLPEQVAVASEFFDPSYYNLQIDDTHVYADDGDGLVRAPVTAGSRFQQFWRGTGPEVRGLALSPTHVYWMTATEGLKACTAATLWRKPKADGLPAVALATYSAACPSMGLLLHGENLYTIITSQIGGAQIMRLRL